MTSGWRSDWSKIEVRTTPSATLLPVLTTVAGSVDTVLDDCFQLISLFFLTIGRNNEAPAMYAIPQHPVYLFDTNGN
jgi:hypothetical protein